MGQRGSNKDGEMERRGESRTKYHDNKEKLYDSRHEEKRGSEEDDVDEHKKKNNAQNTEGILFMAQNDEIIIFIKFIFKVFFLLLSARSRLVCTSRSTKGI